MDDVKRQLEDFRRKQKENQAKGKSGPNDDTSLGPLIPAAESQGDPCQTLSCLSFVTNCAAYRRLCTYPRALFWLKMAVWASCFWLAVKAEFGSVYIIFSMLAGICLNLGKRKPGEPSAYSVFNENCERLPGQITAEQFENEIKRKPL